MFLMYFKLFVKFVFIYLFLFRRNILQSSADLSSLYYLISSTERLMNELSAAPRSMPFSSRAKSMS